MPKKSSKRSTKTSKTTSKKSKESKQKTQNDKNELSNPIIDLDTDFDIFTISQKIQNSDLLEKLQLEISEYTNYDNIQNPYNFKSWWDTLSSSKEAPHSIRKKLYLISLHYLPNSYKLWYNFLKEEREYAFKNFELKNKYFNFVNKLHEQALIYMLKMPVIWKNFIEFLIEQNLITYTRKICDRALQMLPISQHEKIWKIYINFLENLTGCYKLKIFVFQRYCKFNNDYKEKFLKYLIGIKQFQPAIKIIIDILNDENFFSRENKTQYYYWIMLCQIINNYPETFLNNSEIDVEKIIRHGINKYTDEVGNLWVTLTNYYIKIGYIDKVREIFEEALEKVYTVRDFSLVYNSYINFEQEIMKKNIFNNNEEDEEDIKMQNNEKNENSLNEYELKELENAFEELEIKSINEENSKVVTKNKKSKKNNKNKSNNEKNIIENDDSKFNFLRVNNLLQRRDFLLNSTNLRKNKNNVSEWLKRIELIKQKKNFELTKNTYEEAISTINFNEAYGKKSEIYISYANFYEKKKNLKKANEIFYKACNTNFKNTEENIKLWCLWCEMNLRQRHYKNAYQIIKFICTSNSHKYFKYNRNLKLWSLYVDLEKNLTENENQVIYIYNKMIEYKMASSETIFNYISYLTNLKKYNQIFNIYEQSLDLFTWPNAAYDLSLCYLTDYINYYKNSKIEIFRDIIQNIIILSDNMKIFYYIFAFYEEKYGMFNHCIDVLKTAVHSCKNEEKPEIYSVMIAKAAKYFGISKLRIVFDDAMNNLDKSYVLEIGLKYIAIEIKLNEINRARGIFEYLGKMFDPDNKEYKSEFWDLWENFEKLYGNEETYRDMKNVLKLSQLKNNI